MFTCRDIYWFPIFHNVPICRNTIFGSTWHWTFDVTKWGCTTSNLKLKEILSTVSTVILFFGNQYVKKCLCDPVVTEYVCFVLLKARLRSAFKFDSGGDGRQITRRVKDVILSQNRLQDKSSLIFQQSVCFLVLLMARLRLLSSSTVAAAAMGCDKTVGEWNRFHLCLNQLPNV